MLILHEENLLVLQETYNKDLKVGNWMQNSKLKTFKHRSLFSELKHKDPSIYYKVDIGFPRPSFSRGQELRERLSHVRNNRHNAALEKLSRTKERTTPTIL